MKTDTLRKLLLAAMLLTCAALLALCLGGCAADGSFDAAGFNSAVSATEHAYGTYDRSQHPERYSQPTPTP